MAEESTFLHENRYAVVTGANKGIGYEVCRQLASKGLMVVLTARDEKRGSEAVEALKLSDNVVFHQLDVADPVSVASLVKFIKTQFGKLDILVNNAGVGGVILNSDAIVKATQSINNWPSEEIFDWNEIAGQNYELAEECLKINYYGARRMVEAFLPLLLLSDSPRIVNVSSSTGLLQNIPNEWAKGILSNEENLTVERVDEVINEFLKDFKEGSLGPKGWPIHLSAYKLSKAAINAYTRIVARKNPNVLVNAVCPGYVKTDINGNAGLLTVVEGAGNPVRLALLPKGGASGIFFSQKEVNPSF